eukprot:3069891-Amphidinium_carterae.1
MSACAQTNKRPALHNANVAYKIVFAHALLTFQCYRPYLSRTTSNNHGDQHAQRRNHTKIDMLLKAQLFKVLQRGHSLRDFEHSGRFFKSCPTLPLGPQNSSQSDSQQSRWSAIIVLVMERMDGSLLRDTQNYNIANRSYRFETPERPKPQAR